MALPRREMMRRFPPPLLRRQPMDETLPDGRSSVVPALVRTESIPISDSLPVQNGQGVRPDAMPSLIGNAPVLTRPRVVTEPQPVVNDVPASALVRPAAPIETTPTMTDAPLLMRQPQPLEAVPEAITPDPSVLTLTRPREATQDAMGNPVAPASTPLQKLQSYRNSVANGAPEKLSIWKRLALGALMGLGAGQGLGGMAGGAIAGATLNAAMPNLLPTLRRKAKLAEIDSDISRERQTEQQNTENEFNRARTDKLRREPEEEARAARARAIKEEEDRLLQIYKDGDYDPNGTDARSTSISENLRRLQGLGSTLSLPPRKAADRAPMKISKVGRDFIQQSDGRWLDTSTNQVVGTLPVDTSDVPDASGVKPGVRYTADATRANQQTQDARTQAEIDHDNNVLAPQIAALEKEREELRLQAGKLNTGFNQKDREEAEKQRTGRLKEVNSQLDTLRRMTKAPLAPRVQPTQTSFTGQRMSRSKLPEAAKRLNMSEADAERYIQSQGGTIY